ncbi:hypothetical protein NDU88_004459 [Pleurodeles waltl]|uniref:Uncharacterized protein n=1 Tax=Pleurodeles waltl TaxID=8319 RepID=A0AAV7WSD6_PLEWA|nr:hypothetical protein NDU88_004459 [Pleurodeles waltl]
MDNYASPKLTVTKASQGAEALEFEEPTLCTIIAAITELKCIFDPKIDAVTAENNLLRAGFKRISKTVTEAESHINMLQFKSKKMKEQVQHLVQQRALMVARLEDQEERAHRNNLKVVGVPVGAEGPSVDLFMEYLILNFLWP